MIRALLKYLILLIWLLIVLLPCTIIYIGGWEELRKRYVRFVFCSFNLIVGLRVKVTGAISETCPLMVVTNHCSYADIFTIASTFPVSFTPKIDIKSWPLIGYCCRMAGCVFVERKSTSLVQTRERIAEGLEMGRVICLFPEGTTNDSTKVKPFKSGFFSLAEGQESLVIQPATIVYTHVNGKPLDTAGRQEIAWYDDTTLVPHLMRFFSYRNIDAEIHFHDPLTLEECGDRKALCKRCEEIISSHYDKAVA